MIGFIFQSFNLIGFKNAVENVALPLFYQGVGRRKRNQPALEYLDKLGLRDWAHHYPNELSGGQKQRVAIARALITQPQIILADEPTGALDSHTSLEVMEILKDLHRQGLTIVVVTHESGVAYQTEKIVHIKDGMLDTFQEIYGAIMRNKMRTIATGFAVASGLFLIIVLQGAGNGVINSFEANMGNFSFDAIHIFGGMTTKPFEGIKEGRFIQLDSRDVEMTERVFPNYVKDVMPSLEKSGLIASFGQQHISAELMGVRPSWAALDAVKILQGRFINEIDLQQKRKVVVISDSNAKDLFPKEREVIGKALDLSGISYTVVGIYKDEQMSNERTFYAPFTTIAAIYNYGRFINRLSMTIHHIESDTVMEQFMDEYTRAASHIHSFAPDDKRALWIWNQAGDSIQMKKAQNILHTAFWILGLLTLVSGVVGVSNIMLISVKERTREFGIRRAIGARPWSIIRMVMADLKRKRNENRDIE